MAKTIIGRGAEAILEKEGNNLIKRRVTKSYRLPILDEKLRKTRTKKEFKLLEKASLLISVPNTLKTDEKSEIEMEYIQGLKLSDNLDNLPNAKEICIQIGQSIAKLHDADIIHGDLTTSNMIYVSDINDKFLPSDKQKSPSLSLNINNKNKTKSLPADKDNAEPRSSGLDINNRSKDNHDRVYFIDFGLGFESSKIEDKAVDLHLIKQALEAKHFKHYKSFFDAVLEGYKISKNYQATLKRLEAVEKRGRYKQAY